MKRNNKKGFTIVELVIVIAVIAILAAVLIPTFSNVANKAKDSAAIQNARNTYMELLEASDEADVDDNLLIFDEANGRYAAVINGQLETEKVSTKSSKEDAVAELFGGSADNYNIVAYVLGEETLTNVWVVTAK